MKLLLDLLPIAFFFIAYKVGDIYIATLVAIFTSALQVLYSRYKTGVFEKMPLMTLGTLTLLGGATLIFKNELFIKWKPTVIYWILSAAFLLSAFIGHKKTLIQRLLEAHLQLPSKIWLQLNLSWALFFTSLGILNLYVVYHFDTPTWVNFKLFGTTALTFAFVILQGYYAFKHQIPENKEL